MHLSLCGAGADDTPELEVLEWGTDGQVGESRGEGPHVSELGSQQLPCFLILWCVSPSPRLLVRGIIAPFST